MNFVVDDNDDDDVEDHPPAPPRVLPKTFKRMFFWFRFIFLLQNVQFSIFMKSFCFENQI